MAAENAIGLTYDDLLAAIRPRQGISNADLQRAVTAIGAAQQEGKLTAEEAAELIKVMLAFTISSRVNATVNDFFTLGAHGRLGAGLGRPLPAPHGRNFSLI